MFVLLSGSQQLLDVLGDLLSLADDVLRAGERGVRLRFRGVQLWNGAPFSQPTTAPHPPSPAQSVVGGKVATIRANASPVSALKASLGGALTLNHPSLNH